MPRCEKNFMFFPTLLFRNFRQLNSATLLKTLTLCYQNLFSTRRSADNPCTKRLQAIACIQLAQICFLTKISVAGLWIKFADYFYWQTWRQASPTSCSPHGELPHPPWCCYLPTYHQRLPVSCGLPVSCVLHRTLVQPPWSSFLQIGSLQPVAAEEFAGQTSSVTDCTFGRYHSSMSMSVKSI